MANIYMYIVVITPHVILTFGQNEADFYLNFAIMIIYTVHVKCTMQVNTCTLYTVYELDIHVLNCYMI